jgi:hypothetical protein
MDVQELIEKAAITVDINIINEFREEQIKKLNEFKEE